VSASPPMQSPVSPHRIQFIFAQHNQSLELTLRQSLTLGRQVPHESTTIDLTEYGAYRLGLSREHVQIVPSAGHIMIQDLNSRNGTKLNGYELIPHTLYELHDGDMLELGMMGLHVRFVR